MRVQRSRQGLTAFESPDRAGSSILHDVCNSTINANSFQATSAEAKYFYSRDEVKLRDNFIAEFQKQNI